MPGAVESVVGRGMAIALLIWLEGVTVRVTTLAATPNRARQVPRKCVGWKGKEKPLMLPIVATIL